MYDVTHIKVLRVMEKERFIYICVGILNGCIYMHDYIGKLFEFFDLSLLEVFI